MNALKTVIIDDEPRARETIRNMLELYCPELLIVGEGNSVKAGVEVILFAQPDVVLLDIKMPDGTGFDLLKQLPEINFSLVFITAYDEFAIKAFKFNALDYLLKPIDPDELINTVSRITQQETNHNDLSLILDNLRTLSQDQKKIVLKTVGSIYVISVSDIVRCESSGNYTRFFIVGEQPIMVSRTMKEYEEMLKDLRFLRVHQSHLVNIDHIKRFDKSDGGTLIMSEGVGVPVATRKKEVVLMALELL